MLHPGPTGRYLEAVFSPNGRYVCTHASVDGAAWIWDLATRKCIAMMAVRNLSGWGLEPWGADEWMRPVHGTIRR